MARVIVLLLLIIFSSVNLSQLPNVMVEAATVEALRGSRGGGSSSRGGAGSSPGGGSSSRGGDGSSPGGGGGRYRVGLSFPVGAGAGAGAGAAAAGAAAGVGNAGRFRPRAKSAAATTRCTVAGTTLGFGIVAAIAALLI